MGTQPDQPLHTRLRPLAADVSRLWDKEKFLECIDTCLLLSEAVDDVITEAVAEARAAGTPWEAIGLRLGTTRQAVWQRLGHLEPAETRRKKGEGMQTTIQAPSGRQAYFRDLSLEILGDYQGAPVDLERLYEEVEDRSEAKWLDQRLAGTTGASSNGNTTCGGRSSS